MQLAGYRQSTRQAHETAPKPRVKAMFMPAAVLYQCRYPPFRFVSLLSGSVPASSHLHFNKLFDQRRIADSPSSVITALPATNSQCSAVVRNTVQCCGISVTKNSARRSKTQIQVFGAGVAAGNDHYFY